MLREDELLFDGIDGLAKAIVLQACNDYIMVRKGRKIVIDGKKISLDDLLSFFHGRWYGLLTDIPARMLLKHLDKIV
jgi:hypothetical protein